MFFDWSCFFTVDPNPITPYVGCYATHTSSILFISWVLLMLYDFGEFGAILFEQRDSKTSSLYSNVCFNGHSSIQSLYVDFLSAAFVIIRKVYKFWQSGHRSFWRWLSPHDGGSQRWWALVLYVCENNRWPSTRRSVLCLPFLWVIHIRRSISASFYMWFRISTFTCQHHCHLNPHCTFSHPFNLNLSDVTKQSSLILILSLWVLTPPICWIFWSFVLSSYFGQQVIADAACYPCMSCRPGYSCTRTQSSVLSRYALSRSKLWRSAIE